MMHDYVIVGAGSAGCVLAARLSEDPSVKVLLLEAGPDDRVQETAIPAAFSKLFRTERDWAYVTTPQAALDGRRLYWPRGRTLGGSGSLNAMMWVRGIPADYDAWPEGWKYPEVLPYFRRIEDCERDGGEHVGRGGMVRISEQREPNPGTHLFVEAAQKAGIPRNPNANAGDNGGVDYTQVNQIRGRRCSSASAYLRPALKRPNLSVETGALATRVVIEEGRATGVTYRSGGEIRTARAEREVVLCGGAVNSPQLLLLSGIGPADELREVGIEPVVEVAGVGRNLQDHLVAGWVVSTERPDTLVAAESPRQVLRYLLSRKGLLTSNVGEAHAFVKSDPALAGCDLELIFAPVPFLDHGQTVPPGPGYTVGVVLLQPKSTGTITLSASDPRVAPRIDPRYLEDSADLEVLKEGLRIARRVLDTEPLASQIGDPIRPPEWPDSEAALEAHIRATAETLYHPVGTCRMGTDEDAVVDPELRVRGVEGLRVADASVMPSLNRGHTNAPAMMIGERAADLLRASQPV